MLYDDAIDVPEAIDANETSAPRVRYLSLLVIYR